MFHVSSAMTIFPVYDPKADEKGWTEVFALYLVNKQDLDYGLHELHKIIQTYTQPKDKSLRPNPGMSATGCSV